MKSVIKKAKELIAKGNIDAVFQHFNASGLKNNDILLLSSQYYRLVSSEKNDLEINRITNALLELLKDMEAMSKPIDLENQLVRYLKNELIRLEDTYFEENILYQEVYGWWEPVQNFSELEHQSTDVDISHRLSKILKREDKLQPLQELIEEYYEYHRSKFQKFHLKTTFKDNILFLIAEFGTGKSTFLRRYFIQLAKHYLNRKSKEIPILIDLSQHLSKEGQHRFGVIGYFIENFVGVPIDHADFRDNSFIFLIDSLDEAGALNAEMVAETIANLQKIQLRLPIDHENKLIVASRPLFHLVSPDNFLLSPALKPYMKTVLARHSPEAHFITLYGFKKQQFDEFIRKGLEEMDEHSYSPSALDGSVVLKQVINDKNYSPFEDFFERKVIKPSQLKRPFFTYMLLAILKSNSFKDISSLTPTILYLKFFHSILSKKAALIKKSATDPHKNLYNFLFAAARLWQYRRKENGQTIKLYVHEIHQVMLGTAEIKEGDHLLSQADLHISSLLAYGQDEERRDWVYFKHQSFAEFLLALFYFKTFIKHSLSDRKDIATLRALLQLGIVTSQTIRSLEELIRIFQGKNENLDTAAIQQLYYPFLSSILDDEDAKHYFEDASTFRRLLNSGEQHSGQHARFYKWLIETVGVFDSMVRLSLEVLKDQGTYINLQSDVEPLPMNVLYKGETIRVEAMLDHLPLEADRWIALWIGNLLTKDYISHLLLYEFNVFYRAISSFFYFYKNINPGFAQENTGFFSEIFDKIKTFCLDALEARIQKGKDEPNNRAEIGRLWANIGDNRPGVGVKKHKAQILPDIAWVKIEAGKCVVGSTREDPQAFEDEIKSRAEIYLDTFEISKYLITNQQYQAFVNDGGYTSEHKDCWTPDGIEWLKGYGLKHPEDDTPQKFSPVFLMPNHPRVYITWYEAYAFCRWLENKLNLDQTDLVTVRLPTEHQWEKAARGPDGLLFPWGNQFNPTLANMNESGIGVTSAVGLFPEGSSPYGCLDMAGNVSEWTLTHYSIGSSTEADNNRTEGKSHTRILKGGSYKDYDINLRCASKFLHDYDHHLRAVYYGFRIVKYKSIH